MVNIRIEEKASLGEKIRRIRLARGMTQEDLAGREYTRGFVSAVESGRTGISDEALELFARRLGVPVSLFRLDDRTFQLELAEAQRELDQGRPQEAEKALRQLLTLDTLQPRQTAIVRRWLGKALLEQGNVAEAIEQLGRAHAEFVHLGDREQQVRTENLIGVAYYQQDRLPDAIAYHERCLQAYESGVIRDPDFVLRVHANLANEYLVAGNYKAAITHYETALRLSEDAQDLDRLASIHWGICILYRSSGDHEAALRHANQALALYETLGNRRRAAEILLSIGNVYHDLGNRGRAREYYERAYAVGEETGSLTVQATALSNLIEQDALDGRYEEALARVPQALAVADATSRPWNRGNSRLRAGVAYALAGRFEQAEQLFQEAIAIFQEAGLSERLSEAHFRYGEAASHAGRPDLAAEQYRLAYAHGRSAKIVRRPVEPPR
jgi:tetratricopeptide (TPR) repeat protein